MSNGNVSKLVGSDACEILCFSMIRPGFQQLVFVAVGVDDFDQPVEGVVFVGGDPALGIGFAGQVAGAVVGKARDLLAVVAQQVALDSSSSAPLSRISRNASPPTPIATTAAASTSSASAPPPCSRAA